MAVHLPAGREILPPDAPRDTWLAERRRGLGGSDIPLLLGVSNPAHGTEYTLWLDKTGRSAPDGTPTGAMIRGTWLEPHLADVFTERTGLTCEPLGLCESDTDTILRATPDRASSDGGIVEIKSIGEYAKVRHEWRGGGVSRAAYVQGQVEVLVTGRAPLWLVAYEVDQAPVIRGPFAPDVELHKRILSTARTWWDRHIVTDTPPAVDMATITDDEIRARWPTSIEGTAIEAEYPAYVEAMLAERAECHAAEVAAKSRKAEIDAALRVMTGDYAALTIDGAPVVTFTNTDGGPQIDPAAEWEAPELWRQYVTRTPQRRIRIVKRKD